MHHQAKNNGTSKSRHRLSDDLTPFGILRCGMNPNALIRCEFFEPERVVLLLRVKPDGALMCGLQLMLAALVPGSFASSDSFDFASAGCDLPSSPPWVDYLP